MSRTDKDRPYWVKTRETGLIDHDHRNGVCIVSDDRRDRWPSWSSHRSKCKKHSRVEFGCHPKKINGKRELVFDRDDITGFVRNNSKKSCWSWTCDCPGRQVNSYNYVYDDGSYFHGRLCSNRYFVKCLGHTGRAYDASIPCTCDDRAPLATCFPDALPGEQCYTLGGVPSEFISMVYHRPERARERKSLNDMRREYNAHGDLHDGDFHNRQARNGARWLWW